MRVCVFARVRVHKLCAHKHHAFTLCKHADLTPTAVPQPCSRLHAPGTADDEQGETEGRWGREHASMKACVQGTEGKEGGWVSERRGMEQMGRSEDGREIDTLRGY